jgi:hypothetical protein
MNSQQGQDRGAVIVEVRMFGRSLTLTGSTTDGGDLNPRSTEPHEQPSRFQSFGSPARLVLTLLATFVGDDLGPLVATSLVPCLGPGV